MNESIVEQLIQAFQKTTESCKDFYVQYKVLTNRFYELALKTQINNASMYAYKVEKSTWITRWYWNRKFKKSINNLELLLKQCPPPEHFNCRCMANNL
ncbi:hypothetical protein FACS189432_05180 [Bacteroidia bacterium]|nr:hypothetical protein FACS189426_06590 [Bacteroidia bacterium]GHT27925.1 hypothetical protein FACS189432_05180 [Bacteroidia bacterium]